jgi:hypothetical protein
VFCLDCFANSAMVSFAIMAAFRISALNQGEILDFVIFWGTDQDALDFAAAWSKGRPVEVRKY